MKFKFGDKVHVGGFNLVIIANGSIGVYTYNKNNKKVLKKSVFYHAMDSKRRGWYRDDYKKGWIKQ